MRKIITLFAFCTLALPFFAQQTSLRGIIQSASNSSPVIGAKITLVNQNISTTTNQNGEFALVYLEAMDEEVLISANNYLTQVKLVQLHANQSNDIGVIALKEDIQTEMKKDVILQLSENELDDDEGKSQNMSSTNSSRGDVFTSHISYAFSPVRFRVRGYDQEQENTYINGINFNGQERGNFNYSMLGGLNDASRNKDDVNGIEANSFTYGSIGSSTNIQMQASRYARGWKVGLAGTNRNYKGRVNATYATGLLDNGWAFAASVAWRFSPYIDQKNIIGEGTFYNSGAYFFSAEKKLNDAHTVSFVTFGAPTQRAQSAAVTQETYDLAQSIYYNPYWGYQNGKMRNSRVVKSFDPTAIINYEWKIDDHSSLKAGLAYHYSLYSNSALTFYNAPDPRPDYYRNLPSMYFDGQIDANGDFIYTDVNGVGLGNAQTYYSEGRRNKFDYEMTMGPSVDFDAYSALANLWRNRDNNTTQINWDGLYAANRAKNTYDPNASTSYLLERRHNDLQESGLTVNYNNRFTDHLKFIAGLEAKQSQGKHYKTVDDLLGGNQLIDIDPFADRDLGDLATNMGMTQADIQNVKQNDLDNPNRRVTEGDIFGYNYNINMFKTQLYAQNEWNFTQIDFYYALKGTLSTFNRYGNMQNGRAEYLASVYGRGQNAEWQNYYQQLYTSKGKGFSHKFFDPSFKAGITYKINGRNTLKANILAETRAPLARDAYISQRIHDRTVDNLETSKIVSEDLTYELNFPIVRARVTAYKTNIFDGTELNGYYDDEYATFVNQAMTKIDRVYQGLELGVAVKMGTYLTLSYALALQDNHYTSDAYSVTSAENGMALDFDQTGNPLYELRDNVLINGLKVASGPQTATSLKLSFFHPKMWFADITVSYFDRNYLDFTPSHRMQGMFTGLRADGSAVKYPYSTIQATNVDDGTLAFDDSGNPILELDENGHPKVSWLHSALADQEKLRDEKFVNRFLVDMSVGKLIYLPERQSLSINLSISNLLNNTNMKTGGYQQGRIPRNTVQGSGTALSDRFGPADKPISNNVWKFPSKYYYAWGLNLFATITYKF